VAAVRSGASFLFRIVVTLTALAGVVQIFLAGRGVFGIRGATKLDDQSSLDPHRTLGEIIGVAAVVLLLLALIMWNKRLIAWTLVMAVLAEVVQHATATPKHPWVAGLHPVSGVAIVAIAGSLTGSAWRAYRSQRAVAAPDG
jgi:uncharacterized protein DUF6220